MNAIGTMQAIFQDTCICVYIDQNAEPTDRNIQMNHQQTNSRYTTYSLVTHNIIKYNIQKL